MWGFFPLSGPACVAPRSTPPRRPRQPHACGNTLPEPPSLLAQDLNEAWLHSYLTRCRFSGKLYGPPWSQAPVCLQPRGAEQDGHPAHPGPASSHQNTGIRQGSWGYEPFGGELKDSRHVPLPKNLLQVMQEAHARERGWSWRSPSTITAGHPPSQDYRPHRTCWTFQPQNNINRCLFFPSSIKNTDDARNVSPSFVSFVGLL